MGTKSCKWIVEQNSCSYHSFILCYNSSNKKPPLWAHFRGWYAMIDQPLGIFFILCTVLPFILTGFKTYPPIFLFFFSCAFLKRVLKPRMWARVQKSLATSRNDQHQKRCIHWPGVENATGVWSHVQRLFTLCSLSVATAVIGWP